jgi:hypothetical protein
VLGITPIVCGLGVLRPELAFELDALPLDAAAVEDEELLLLPHAATTNTVAPTVNSINSRLTFRNVQLLSQAESKTPACPSLAIHLRSCKFYQPIG